MLTFSLSFFSVVLLLFSYTTTAQPYNATDRFFLACGSPSSTTTTDPKWDGDQNSKFVPSNISTSSFSATPSQQDPSVPQIPHSHARIFNASFTYRFPVSQGPKFLRLYFYPATYSDLKPEQSYFSVSSNGYSLLTNFSAFLTASYLKQTNFIKEYMIYVTETQSLTVTFTPSPNSYAFINGIEILSMPENLYFNSIDLKYVGVASGPGISDDMALEKIYRLNVGGGYISGENDTGMYRTWEKDNSYIYGEAPGWTPIYEIPIMYTLETPNYTAPELVYQTQRSMGNMSDLYNLTWILPVDSGFFYNLRLHFCNIIPQYTKQGQVIFKVFINNQTADEGIDLFHLTQGSGYPVFKDYVVFVEDPDGSGSKHDLWVAMHPNPSSQLSLDAYLNGLEAFKLTMDRNLSSPNPELSYTTPPAGRIPIREENNNKPPYAVIIGGIGGALVLVSVIVLIVVWQRRRVKRYDVADKKSSYGPAYGESKSGLLESISIRIRGFSSFPYSRDYKS